MFVTDKEVDQAEELGSRNSSLEHQLLCKLASEVRSLRHQLADPNYLYSGSRIHRQAILSRNMEIASLREKLGKQAPEAVIHEPVLDPVTKQDLRGKYEPCCECGNDYPREDLVIRGEIYCAKCREEEKKFKKMNNDEDED